VANRQGLFHGQKSNAAYCAVNMAMRWYHTYDLAYARRVYPFVRAVADFWTDYMDKDGERYVIRNDSIHEGSGHDFNPILSLGLVRMTLRLVLDMSAALAMDQDQRALWRHMLAHISEFPVQVRDGKAVFRYSEQGMDWCDGNTLGIQHIFPAGEIGLESAPPLLAVARNTLAAMPRWQDPNGMSSIYPVAVRLGWDPLCILREMKSMIESIGLANGFIRDNPHGIENCSIVPATINEMLCTAHQRVLRVFKVWPRETDASFRDLRVPGAFLVSGALRDGEIAPLDIRSEQGQPCIVENPWPTRQVQVWRDGQAAEKVMGERFDLLTRPGEQLRLAPYGVIVLNDLAKGIISHDY
jgi:alpha-L-fucosidase 2